MKKFFKTYFLTIAMIVSMVIGTIAGLIFKEKAAIVSPLGDLFINMLLVIIVPLIFLTISTSIAKINKPKRISKIFSSIIGVFIVASLISVLIGIGATRFKLVDSISSQKIKASLVESTMQKEKLNILERTVSAISTNDFAKIISKDNLLALIVFSILMGIAIKKSSNGKKFLEVLDSANSVLQEFIKIIMYYAPVGLGCYFAAFVGSFGSSIAVGYLKALLIYTAACLFTYVIVYSIYALIAGGKKGLKVYWKNIIPTTLAAIATCSSAACIPINIEATKKIGVADDIANTTIPLGTTFHKDGSIIGSVFKIMFLVYLFNTGSSFFTVLGVSLLATLLVAAVPIGGGTISEMLIITMMGFPVSALPILTMIATIIDAPATVLNVVGDCASSMLVSRIVDNKKSF